MLFTHTVCFPFDQWSSTDVSSVIVIGDNYEAETIFLVTGYQYISSAMAYNFGYEFRQAWCRNYLFVFFATLYTVFHFYATMDLSRFSCMWRVNCINENVVSGVTSSVLPIQNNFNTTVMPEYYRRALLGIMIGNAFAISAWDYFVVNGIRQHFAAKKRANKIITYPDPEVEVNKMDDP